MIMLELKDLSKRFGEHCVVDGADLRIEAGESLALIGPSGCGKTTLLRMVAGLESPSSGTITLDGAILNNIEPAKRSVQLAFQAPLLYPFMTVRRNLEFVRQRDGGVSGRECAEICQVFDIVDVLDKRPQQVSGGETQRVALARILMRRSRIALLDEPLSDVDPLLARRIRQDVSSRLRARGTVVIYVTHDQEEAALVGDRIAVMRSGVIHQVGRATELYEHPATAFVAEFLSDGGVPKFEARLIEGRAGVRYLSAFRGDTCIKIPARLELAMIGDVALHVLARGAVVEVELQRDLPGPCIRGHLKRLESGFGRSKCVFEAPDGALWSVDVGAEVDVINISRRGWVDMPAEVNLAGADLLLFSKSGHAMARFKVSNDAALA